MDILRLLWQYLALINTAAFVAFAYDKALAKAHLRRVPEATLLWFSVLGGAAGGLLAMALVRHKTRKWKFKLLMPALLLLQLALLCFGVYCMHSTTVLHALSPLFK